jgi:hypothetical protein
MFSSEVNESVNDGLSNTTDSADDNVRASG